MVKTKIIKKTIIALLIISLIYANINLAILGSITYAIDNTNAQIEATENEKSEEEKVLKIEISDFNKNNMQEQETEYQEKLTLALEQDKEIGRIKISDMNTKINFETVEENEADEQEEESIESEETINIFYKTTKINKDELLNKIGTNGVLEIKYNELKKEAQINETEEEQVITEEAEETDIIVLPEVEEENTEKENVGIINAENGSVTINSETEADEAGNITIVYPENTISVEMTIKTEVQKIENLEILNNKSIAKVSDIDRINELETAKQVTIQGRVEVIEETIKTPIEYTKTFAELGIDKNQISTTVENKLNLTITMHTESIKYDLNKNPYFVIELPNIVDMVTIDNMVILNNPCFTITSVEQGTLENGNKAITIKLEGEQTEHTKSIEENTQIVLETSIKTRDLIPTTENAINLYYQNENVKTYDGKTIQENGFNSVPMQFITNKEVIVQTQAIIGEQTINSPRDNYNTVIVEPNTYQSATIIGTVINNLGEDIKNAKILGSSTNIGQISGVEKIYYSENENATADLTDPNNNWKAEYTANAKKYLIIVDNFAQAQTIQFGYYMSLPANIEEDIVHEPKFEVYDSNNQVVQTSQVTINQEAEKFDTYSDEKINAEMIISSEKVEIEDLLECTINISNISGEQLNNISLNIDVPEGIRIFKKEIESSNNIGMSENENAIEVSSFNLEKDGSVSIKLVLEVKEHLQDIETIITNINYEKGQTEIFKKVTIIKPSTIETTITSDKQGSALEANEEINYTVTLKNTGDSHAEIEISIPELEDIDITKVNTVNKSTGKERSISAASLSGNVAGININPEETVEIYITGIAKEMKTDSVATMYVDVEGKRIENTTTEKISNTIKKTVNQEETNNVVQATSNSITGVAWIDKNENGQKDEDEILLKGVQAVLIDTQTSEQVAAKTTNNNGEYSFDNVEEGNYIVEFKYNTNNFTVTDYKNENVADTLDSDVINTTQNNTTTAKTGIISLYEGKTESVNAGFVINKKFDMSINKGITKVTVTNEQGTNTYEFGGINMAKVEIDGQYLKGSMILVEYEVAVTNTGEVEGYAKLISDKIPEGMQFNSELNKDWYEGSDGNLYSAVLANKKLLPGETATIKLVLTKEMTDDKVTSPVNTANIEETFNEYLIYDKETENNIAEATIIISLTTGKSQNYIWLILIVIAIIGMGTIGVTKIVKHKEIQ